MFCNTKIFMPTRGTARHAHMRIHTDIPRTPDAHTQHAHHICDPGTNTAPSSRPRALHIPDYMLNSLTLLIYCE
jgi:hypothetical protein